MTHTKTLSFLLAAVLGLGCGTTQDGGDRSPDAASSGDDAINSVPLDAAEDQVIPTWSLEDIQPESPMFGQTYGLDTFSDKTLVVLLVTGF